ncbi:hypothetical protein GT360_06000 [Vibrio astriarenae]|uniref:Uncharacterized protein n=1 Tax=Vibrio astriarenae TaxID=1481923 RepID=A0A7Z2YD80_9VIBR|nr:DUF6559 family protein [Vibrio astriarenae]QIA63091.1 hypothetical protein GT360_06000 [Vibrio astriarenae]
MFRYIQRRRIKKVIKSLSPILIKSYGSRDYFTLGQVQMSSDSLCKRQKQIALALFADPKILELESNPSLKSLRHDISFDFFLANEYNARDVLNLLGKGGWKGGRMNDDMSHRMGMHSRY